MGGGLNSSQNKKCDYQCVNVELTEGHGRSDFAPTSGPQIISHFTYPLPFLVLILSILKLKFEPWGTQFAQRLAQSWTMYDLCQGILHVWSLDESPDTSMDVTQWVCILHIKMIVLERQLMYDVTCLHWISNEIHNNSSDVFPSSSQVWDRKWQRGFDSHIWFYQVTLFTHVSLSASVEHDSFVLRDEHRS